MKNLKGQKIFLIDAVGAVASVLCLYILYSFEGFFGMPQSVLKIFIFIAIIFSIYSFTNYLISPPNWKFYLTIIALLNISYCLFTMYEIFQNIDTITLFGYTYFIAEICVVLIVSIYEIKLARATNK